MKKKETKKKQASFSRSESFDEFLAREGLLAETEDAAIKEIIADQIKVAMGKKGLSKTAMAAREDEPAAIGSAARSGQSVCDAGNAAAGGERGGKKFEGGVGMSPDQYLKQICEPCVDEFMSEPTSIRRAWVAAIALLHFEDYLARHRHTAVSTIRTELLNDFPQFDAIQDIGNANKHFVRSYNSSRQGLSVQNYTTGPAAAFDDGTYFDDGTSWSESSDVVRIEFNGEIIDALNLCQSCLKYFLAKV